MMRLGEVAREIPGDTEISGDAGVMIRGVHHDSRRVEPGDLFVARAGQAADGRKFIGAALAKGAVAVLAGRDADLGDLDETGVPVLRCADVASGLAYSAAAVYGHPSFALEVVGITGTNGKTTTAHLVQSAVDGALGAPRCGTIGTVGHRFGELFLPAEHTTPEADEIARLLARMRRAGASHVAMEVSSIALELGRVRAVRFRVAAFTNLTQDHLDFHGTMENYGDAKKLLFTRGAAGAAVVHVGDPFGRALADMVETPLVRVSARTDVVADIYPRAVESSARGIVATLVTPVGELVLRSRLVGIHNLENLVVALGVAHVLEIDLAKAAAALGASGSAPGRLERCDGEGDDLTVLVDYAHTPDALARVLDATRPRQGSPGSPSGAKLWCVFGCGGDRDPSKRDAMGRAVAERADVAIITSDNPRTEDPADIAAPVEAAVRDVLGKRGQRNQPTGSSARYLVELDRAAAIDQAIAGAAPGDVVVIAGKGHEDYQIVGTEKRHFDDREEARRALGVRRGATRSGRA
jgi:UDP-N-acetylmuramoyl-L-alanyl-D-glutamate--2,6-diaminopimelate ligase